MEDFNIKNLFHDFMSSDTKIKTDPKPSKEDFSNYTIILSSNYTYDLDKDGK